MARLFRVYVHESGITHYALARREDLAEALPAEDVTSENWWHWKTVCGREVIAHTGEYGLAPLCKQCVDAMERARRTVAELRARFGDGLD